MKISVKDQGALDALEIRLRTILPAQYQDCYDDVQPVSMGSAGLKFSNDGKVAWNEIWHTFCDLAMAGGPPHKGKLLEPGSRVEIDAQAARYGQVVEDICRGVRMVARLAAQPSPIPGWVRVDCANEGMAGWLLRAIVMENISTYGEGTVVHLPAGPSYQMGKEIKNVITVIAKTNHYWLGHIGAGQQSDIADLFAKMAVESPLIQPAFVGSDYGADRHQMLCEQMAQGIHQATGLRRSNHQYFGWLGLECPDIRAAIWMMRGLIVSNVLSRREETTLFVPVNLANDPKGETVVRSLVRVHRFAVARNILSMSR